MSALKRILFLFVGIIALLFVALFSINNYVPNLRNTYAGNVNDTFGNPIAGVSIDFIYENKTFARVLSNTNGEFTLRTNENNIDRLSAKKDGYLFTYNGITIKKPFKFLGWKDDGTNSIESHKGLKQIKFTEGKANVLLGDSTHLDIKADVSNTSWILVFSMNNGFLIESFDGYPIKAPRDNYTKELLFRPSQEQERGTAIRLIYFKVIDGKKEKYGWFRFKFKPYSSKGVMVYIIDWGVNNSGQPDLLHPSDGYTNFFSEMIKTTRGM